MNKGPQQTEMEYINVVAYMTIGMLAIMRGLF